MPPVTSMVRPLSFTVASWLPVSGVKVRSTSSPVVTLVWPAGVMLPSPVATVVSTLVSPAPPDCAARKVTEMVWSTPTRSKV